MRILRLHEASAESGGADRLRAAEAAWLHREGHEVRELVCDGVEFPARGHLARLRARWRTAFNRALFEEVRRACRAFRPHVAHAGDMAAPLSRSVLAACRTEGVATVQSLRIHRWLCRSGPLPPVPGESRHTCSGRPVRPGVEGRRRRASRALAAAMARRAEAHRQPGALGRDVDLFLAPSWFAQRAFVEAGWDPERIVVRPDFVDDPGPSSRPGRGGVYVGRLAEEKDVLTLLRAWRGLRGVPLTLVGDGPARAALEREAARLGPDAAFFAGHRDAAGVVEALHSAAFLVSPSARCESFGRAVVEAFACGRTVLVARGGAAADLVAEGRNGITFARGDEQDLAAKAAWLAARPEPCRRLGAAARRAYDRRYAPGGNLRMLVWAYTVARRLYERGTGAPIIPARHAPAEHAAPVAPAPVRGASVRTAREGLRETVAT